MYIHPKFLRQSYGQLRSCKKPMLTTNRHFPPTDTRKSTGQLTSCIPATVKLCKRFKCFVSTAQNNKRTSKTHEWLNPFKTGDAKRLHFNTFRAILVRAIILNFLTIRALWRSGMSARVPECQKNKKWWLDQYGPECFHRLILPQSEKCGTEGLICVPSEKYQNNVCL